MIPRITIYGILSLIIVIGCWFAITTHKSERTTTTTALVRIIPTIIENQNVYPTNHAVVFLDPLQAYVWQRLTLPNSWVDRGYYFEIWDSGNKPVPGFLAKKLSSATIDLSTIDPSLYPALRLVIFQPATVGNLDFSKPIYFQYREAPNTKLIVLAGIIVWLYISIIWLLWVCQISLRDIPKYTSNLLRGQTLPPLPSTLLTITWSGVFGIVLGCYAGGIQIVYVLIKLPFLLLGAWAISLTTLLLVTTLLGQKASLKEVFTQSLNLLAVTALGLASFSSLVLFYIWFPLGHDQILLASIGFIGLAGLLAMLRLWQWSKSIVITVVWLVCYGLVFLQLGWILRPWVGVLDPISNSVPFARPYSGNVFTELSNTLGRLND